MISTCGQFQAKVDMTQNMKNAQNFKTTCATMANFVSNERG